MSSCLQVTHKLRQNIVRAWSSLHMRFLLITRDFQCSASISRLVQSRELGLTKPVLDIALGHQADCVGRPAPFYSTSCVRARCKEVQRSLMANAMAAGLLRQSHGHCGFATQSSAFQEQPQASLGCRESFGGEAALLMKESHNKSSATSGISKVLHQMGKNIVVGHTGACAGLKKTRADSFDLPNALSTSGGACRLGFKQARHGGNSERLARWVCASTGGTDAVEVGDNCSDGQSVVLDGQSQSFVLHDLMHNDGVSVEYAKAARANFAIEAARAVTNDPTLDLARATLEIAAEDDALVSHSVVPLPVESYLSRLDVMAAEVANHHLPANVEERTPRAVFDALNKYLFTYQGFKRAQMRTKDDPRESYLNGVLTRRVGTSMMLALIYSEIAQRLLRWGYINFQVQMQLPSDPITLPQPQAVRDDGAEGSSPNKDNEFDLNPDSILRGEAVMLTPVLLLAEVLTALKRAYWPWRWHRTSSTGSGFLEAAEAAARGGEGAQLGAGLLDNSEAGRGSGAEIAAARSAKYRLKRGIWTSVGAGDLRRALAATERLCLLGLDNRDLRDYGVLLFHCGQYKQAYHFLETYQAREGSAGVPSLFNPLAAREGAALRALMERLTLILAERAWYAPTAPEPKEPPADPW